jgi:hypothetical protein
MIFLKVKDMVQSRYIHDVSMMFILNYKFCLSKNVYMLLVF